MGSSENFCLRWNDFESNVSGAFKELRADRDFFDVTLACDDGGGGVGRKSRRTLQAHKVILSACSSFFKDLLRDVTAASPGHPNPLLYLRGIRLADLESVLDFMYHGEVNVAQDELNNFLAVAEDLQIKGLTQPGSSSGASKTGLGGNLPRKAPLRRSLGSASVASAASSSMAPSSSSSLPRVPIAAKRRRQTEDHLTSVVPASAAVSMAAVKGDSDGLDLHEVKNEPAFSAEGGVRAGGVTREDNYEGGGDNFDESYQSYDDDGGPADETGRSGDGGAGAEDESGLMDDDAEIVGVAMEGSSSSTKGVAAEAGSDDYGGVVFTASKWRLHVMSLPDGMGRCIPCNKVFKRLAAAKRHYDVFHVGGTSTYECCYCKRTFNEYSFRTHLNAKHGIVGVKNAVQLYGRQVE